VYVASAVTGIRSPAVAAPPALKTPIFSTSRTRARVQSELAQGMRQVPPQMGNQVPHGLG
jgi:hypothetical protein